MIGNVPKKGDVVIDEATVCSAVIEEEWVPIVEQASGLKFNEDFFIGYSPERIIPGDEQQTVEKIIKVNSGSTEGKRSISCMH